MRLRPAHLFALCAWLFATGSHWDLVQTFAWGRMIVVYSQSMPLSQAVRLTFTPDNLCCVCKAVAAAKKDATSNAVPGNPADGKILLAFAKPPSVIFGLVELARHSPVGRPSRSCDRPAPPDEPPRAV